MIKYYSNLKVSMIVEKLDMSQTWKCGLQTFDGWKNYIFKSKYQNIHGHLLIILFWQFSATPKKIFLL